MTITVPIPAAVTPPIQADVAREILARDFGALATVVSGTPKNSRLDNNLSREDKRAAPDLKNDFQLPLSLEELEIYDQVRFKPAASGPGNNEGEQFELPVNPEIGAVVLNKTFTVPAKVQIALDAYQAASTLQSTPVFEPKNVIEL